MMNVALVRKNAGRLALIISLSLGMGACAGGQKAKVPPGRCFENSDCPQGEACRDTRCEDIYYPKNKIRQF